MKISGFMKLMMFWLAIAIVETILWFAGINILTPMEDNILTLIFLASIVLYYLYKVRKKEVKK